jgi:hypothetical protein
MKRRTNSVPVLTRVDPRARLKRNGFVNKAQKGDSRRCLHGEHVPLRLRRYDKSNDGPAHRIILQADASVVGFNKCLANRKSEAEASG